ncbi:MAG: nitroreductase family protein [Balneolaceae bacterium]
MGNYSFILLPDFKELPVEEMRERAHSFYRKMRQRRSVRSFSDRPVQRAIIEDCLRAAGTAPSGANMQPWHFVAVKDPNIKKRIREEAEQEERDFYRNRASDEWLEALEPLGTSPEKPFLTEAPWLIVVFSQSYGIGADGDKQLHYYVKESVGIATGILITGLHQAGLATLTHTPSPMGFLNKILDRPVHEKPFLVLVAGYPAEDARVPDITKKKLDEITTFI